MTSLSLPQRHVISLSSIHVHSPSTNTHISLSPIAIPSCCLRQQNADIGKQHRTKRSRRATSCFQKSMNVHCYAQSQATKPHSSLQSRVRLEEKRLSTNGTCTTHRTAIMSAKRNKLPRKASVHSGRMMVYSQERPKERASFSRVTATWCFTPKLA